MLNQKTLFVPRDNVIFSWCRIPSPRFRAEGVILNLSHCDIRFISRDAPRIENNEK